MTINDPEIADVHHRDRTITIVAKYEGLVTIKVLDMLIPESYPAEAELLISDVFRLEIDGECTLIESGQTTNLTVTAFDAYNNQFDPEQQKLIKFFPEVQATGTTREKELHIVNSKELNNEFIATGRDPGTY